MFLYCAFLTSCGSIMPTVKEYAYSKDNTLLSVVFTDSPTIDNPDNNLCDHVKMIMEITWISKQKETGYVIVNPVTCEKTSKDSSLPRTWKMVFSISPYKQDEIKNVFFLDSWSTTKMKLDGTSAKY